MLSITLQRILEELNGVKPSKMMKELGFSSGLFSQWKANAQNPAHSSLEKVANYLNVSVDYLEGKTDIRKPMTQNNISEADNKILTLYHQLPPELQEKYMKDLELLSKLSNNQ